MKCLLNPVIRGFLFILVLFSSSGFLSGDDGGNVASIGLSMREQEKEGGQDLSDLNYDRVFDNTVDDVWFSLDSHPNRQLIIDKIKMRKGILIQDLQELVGRTPGCEEEDAEEILLEHLIDFAAIVSAGLLNENEAHGEDYSYVDFKLDFNKAVDGVISDFSGHHNAQKIIDTIKEKELDLYKYLSGLRVGIADKKRLVGDHVRGYKSTLLKFLFESSKKIHAIYTIQDFDKDLQLVLSDFERCNKELLSRAFCNKEKQIIDSVMKNKKVMFYDVLSFFKNNPEYRYSDRSIRLRIIQQYVLRYIGSVIRGISSKQK